jgi:hypothetical protein
MTTAAPSVRKKIPICFSIDIDAEQLLRAMVPSGRGTGALLSELIRKEAREREGRAGLLTMFREESAAGTT